MIISSVLFKTRAFALLAALMFSAAAQAERVILVYGDSLSAGYGIRQDAAWPALLAARLKKESYDYSVVNASISGETTSGGSTRLPDALSRHRPSIVIIALGSNDGLRGTPLRVMRDNLAKMIRASNAARAQVLVVGQRVPPNFGTYAEQFHEVFGEVARETKAARVDFLLEGVAAQDELFQADRLHPTAKAQPYLLDNVWKGLVPLLRR